MKKLSLALCMILAGCTLAQTKTEKWNAGIHGGLTQYSGDLGQGFYDFSQPFYGFGGLSVSRYLTRRLDASILATYGVAGYEAERTILGDQTALDNFKVRLGTANLLLRLHLRDREKFFGPFVFAGLSGIQQISIDGRSEKRNKFLEFSAPTAGVGFNLRFTPIISLQFQEMFMYMLADDVDQSVADLNDMYLFHTLGLTFNLAKLRKRVKTNGNDVDKCPEYKTGPERVDGEGKGMQRGKKSSKKSKDKFHKKKKLAN
jgi:OmpA-OmpF porin, OOP family